jgi:hypothetical protein
MQIMHFATSPFAALLCNTLACRRELCEIQQDRGPKDRLFHTTPPSVPASVYRYLFT